MNDQKALDYAKGLLRSGRLAAAFGLLDATPERQKATLANCLLPLGCSWERAERIAEQAWNEYWGGK